MPGTGAVFSQKFTMNVHYSNFAALTSFDGAEEKGYGKLPLWRRRLLHIY